MSSAEQKMIYRFEEIRKEDVMVAGGKGANLGGDDVCRSGSTGRLYHQQ